MPNLASFSPTTSYALEMPKLKHFYLKIVTGLVYHVKEWHGGRIWELNEFITQYHERRISKLESWGELMSSEEEERWRRRSLWNRWGDYKHLGRRSNELWGLLCSLWINGLQHCKYILPLTTLLFGSLLVKSKEELQRWSESLRKKTAKIFTFIFCRESHCFL